MTTQAKVLLVGVTPEEVLAEAPDLAEFAEFSSDPVLAHHWTEEIGVEFQAMIVAGERPKTSALPQTAMSATTGLPMKSIRAASSEHKWIILVEPGSESFRVLKFSSHGVDTLRRLLRHEEQEAEVIPFDEALTADIEDPSSLQAEFISNISHEFRTPLNGILGYVGLLRDGLYGPVTEEQHEAFDHIARCATHLLDLINEVLDLSKLKNDQLELEKDFYSPYELVQSVTDAMQPAVLEKELQLDLRCDDGLPSVYVDFHRIYQVLKNLVDNAIKFTHIGRVEVGARRIEGAIEFYVRDTGIGIPAESLSTIFEEFRQADGSTTRHYGGIGIGLSLARRLIELHGGELRVESREHHGSTFSFTIPLRGDTPKE